MEENGKTPIGKPVDWMRELPAIHKLIMLLIAVFLSGGSFVAAIQYYTDDIPEMVIQNTIELQKAAEERELARQQIQRILTIMQNMRLEMRLSTCTSLKIENPNIDMTACMEKPVPTFINP